MHLKLTTHGRFCKQNNQLPTKSHDELEDNSNERDFVTHLQCGFFLCMVPLCIISLQGGDCCMTPSLLKMAALLRQPQNTVEHV